MLRVSLSNKTLKDIESIFNSEDFEFYKRTVIDISFNLAMKSKKGLVTRDEIIFTYVSELFMDIKVQPNKRVLLSIFILIKNISMEIAKQLPNDISGVYSIEEVVGTNILIKKG